MLSTINHLMNFAPEVQKAKEAKRPIVALESTLIAHGLPYPDNLETTHAMQQAIRDQGAVPATIALIDGQIKIGLTHSEIQMLSDLSHPTLKVNRADIPYCLAKKATGATTVSATAFCAAKAGIRIFATGGMGGVHRGAEHTFDISCDLTELSRTPIAVVCSGVKALLDIPKTLEYLETLSVPIVGYQTNSFPIFYSAASKYALSQSVESVEAAAAVLQLHFMMRTGGIMIANPIPNQQALDAAKVEAWIDEATKIGHQQGVQGKAVTPFLLKKIVTLSAGQTLKANIALLIHNAAIGAKIACALEATG